MDKQSKSQPKNQFEFSPDRRILDFGDGTSVFLPPLHPKSSAIQLQKLEKKLEEMNDKLQAVTDVVNTLTSVRESMIRQSARIEAVGSGVTRLRAELVEAKNTFSEGQSATASCVDRAVASLDFKIKESGVNEISSLATTVSAILDECRQIKQSQSGAKEQGPSSDDVINHIAAVTRRTIHGCRNKRLDAMEEHLGVIDVTLQGLPKKLESRSDQVLEEQARQLRGVVAKRNKELGDVISAVLEARVKMIDEAHREEVQSIVNKGVLRARDDSIIIVKALLNPGNSKLEFPPLGAEVTRGK